MIERPAVARAILDPVRAQILSALAEPGSATSVANEIGLSRQKVNYHLRALERLELVELVEERARRGLTERVMVASARSYVLSPAALGENAADPSRTDRLSARYLIAIAARIVREVADLDKRADDVGKPLATLTIDTEIRFRSASDRASFTSDITQAVNSLAAKYHDELSVDGRSHRFVVASYPLPITTRSATRGDLTHG